MSVLLQGRTSRRESHAASVRVRPRGGPARRSERQERQQGPLRVYRRGASEEPGVRRQLSRVRPEVLDFRVRQSDSPQLAVPPHLHLGHCTSLVSVSYELQVTVAASGLRRNLDLSTPIIIGTVPVS